MSNLQAAYAAAFKVMISSDLLFLDECRSEDPAAYMWSMHCGIRSH